MQKVIILLFTMCLATCDENLPDHEGAKCVTTTGEAGVCKKFRECQYAMNLVKKKKRIKDCFFSTDVDRTRFVCCAESNEIRETKPIEPLTVREVIKDGILRTDDIECRFNGTFPVICCALRQDYTTLKFNEPEKCPNLKEPYIRNELLLPHESVIYDACYAYSRIGSKCMKSEGYSDRYERDDCSIFLNTPKISDGDPAMVKEFPHMAVLGCAGRASKEEIVWVGGGALISEYYVLTAAHAVVSKDYGFLKYALLGTISKTDTRSGNLFFIVDIKRHPRHNVTTKMNDIALIKLHTRVTFSDFIRPACLSFPGILEKFYNETIIAGWGRKGQKADTSDILLKAIVYEEDHAICEHKLRGKYFKWDVNTMICAGASEARKRQDSCEGDSGGPLMAKTKELPCSYFIAGIVSWGPYCGVGHPGSYTNASYPQYQEWIVRTVWPQQLKARQISLS